MNGSACVCVCVRSRTYVNFVFSLLTFFLGTFHVGISFGIFFGTVACGTTSDFLPAEGVPSALFLLALILQLGALATAPGVGISKAAGSTLALVCSNQVLADGVGATSVANTVVAIHITAGNGVAVVAGWADAGGLMIVDPTLGVATARGSNSARVHTLAIWGALLVLVAF